MLFTTRGKRLDPNAWGTQDSLEKRFMFFVVVEGNGYDFGVWWMFAIRSCVYCLLWVDNLAMFSLMCLYGILMCAINTCICVHSCVCVSVV